MVWINTIHQNYSPPRKKGEIVFGGAMCVCGKCCDERVKKAKKESKEFYKECIS